MRKRNNHLNLYHINGRPNNQIKIVMYLLNRYLNIYLFILFSWTIIIIQFTTIQMSFHIQVYCRKLSTETSRSDCFCFFFFFFMVLFFIVIWLIWLNTFICWALHTPLFNVIRQILYIVNEIDQIVHLTIIFINFCSTIEQKPQSTVK